MKSNNNLQSGLQEQGNIESSVEYWQRLDIPKDARVLDIGTRHGSFLKRLFDIGYHDLHGIDIDEPAIEEGKRAYPELSSNLHVFDGLEIPFDSETFDAVTMFDVIEHVPEPLPFLRKVYDVLKPSGVFVFQTPNIFVNVPWEIIHWRSLTGWRRYHCSLQTLYSLRRLLVEAGFADIVIEKHRLVTEHNIRKVRRALGPVGPPILRSLRVLPLALTPNFWGHCEKRGQNAASVKGRMSIRSAR